MLVVRRKKGESILIGDNIEISIAVNKSFFIFKFSLSFTFIIHKIWVCINNYYVDKILLLFCLILNFLVIFSSI